MSPSKSNKDQPVVLVTGASTGIGLALVKKLAVSGYRVVATARKSSLSRFSESGLRDNEHLHIRALDVTNLKEQEILVDEVNQNWGGIDVLINNAGISFRSAIEEMNPEGDIKQFETNYFGPVNLVRLVLPSMRKKHKGHIINVSSVGGMMAMPTMGAYSASKFALEGMSEALWYELKPWGIRVSLIQPGFVHSKSFRNVRLSPKSRNSVENTKSPYHLYYANLEPFIEKMMNLSPATPEKIAARIIKTMNQRHPPLRVAVTPDAWIFYYLRRLLPSRIYHFILFRSLPEVSSWVDFDKD